MEKVSFRSVLGLAMVLMIQPPAYPHAPHEGNSGNFFGILLGGGGAVLTLGVLAGLLLLAARTIRRSEVLTAATLLLVLGWGVATGWIFDTVLNEAFQYHALVRGVPLDSRWPRSLLLCFLLDALGAALLVGWSRRVWRHRSAHDAGTAE